MKPLISIIVPVYNVEDYISKCLESLRRQKYENIEIIIIDDGSTDKSGEMCDAFAKTEKRAKVFHQENGGLSSARNAGIKKSKGEIIAFVDSDDYVKDNYILDLYKVMEENKADISVCGYNDVFPKREVVSGKEATVKLLTRQENIDIISWNKLYKKKLFIDNEIFFPEGDKHEDTLTTYKLLSKARKVAYIDESLYIYIERKGSIMAAGKIEERLLMRERAAREATEYFKQNADLEQAAEVCLLWAKYNFLNYAISGDIGRSYKKEILDWLRQNKNRYKDNKYLSCKLKFYNFIAVKFGGRLYSLIKKLV